MAVTVRPVASNEKEIWNQLFQAYADFYKVESTQEKRDAVWGWIFDDNENFWCAVAEKCQNKCSRLGAQPDAGKPLVEARRS